MSSMRWRERSRVCHTSPQRELRQCPLYHGGPGFVFAEGAFRADRPDKNSPAFALARPLARWPAGSHQLLPVALPGANGVAGVLD